MPEFSKVSKDRLATCDQRLQDVLNEAIKYIDFVVLEGHRGEAAQNIAYDTHKSQLRWPKGKHNSMPSKAVDVWPYIRDVGLDWGDIIAGARLMGYIQRIADARGVKLRFGVDWDGDFRTAGMDPNEKFRDIPHVELAE